jgi:uncharacterized protein YjbJ (UPF0337 family)
MNKNSMNGIVDELVGSAKRKVGSITHNPKLQVRGIAQQGKGKVESALGKAQDAIKDAVGNAELHTNRHVSADSKKSSGNSAPTKITEPMSDAYRVKKV